MAKHKRPETRPGSVRIIGGAWRRRRIPVPPDAVRPTPDRVRETLFNWLAPTIEGSRCLDLFAGSGALGGDLLDDAVVNADEIQAWRVHTASNARTNVDEIIGHLGAR